MREDRCGHFAIPSMVDGKIMALEYDEDCSLRNIIISDAITKIEREAFNCVGILKESSSVLL